MQKQRSVGNGRKKNYKTEKLFMQFTIKESSI